jgi:hypothetical protein
MQRLSTAEQALDKECPFVCMKMQKQTLKSLLDFFGLGNLKYSAAKEFFYRLPLQFCEGQSAGTDVGTSAEQQTDFHLMRRRISCPIRHKSYQRSKRVGSILVSS